MGEVTGQWPTQTRAYTCNAPKGPFRMKIKWQKRKIKTYIWHNEGNRDIDMLISNYRKIYFKKEFE